MSSGIYDLGKGPVKKFELDTFKEEDAAAKKINLDDEFEADTGERPEREFVLGGFDFDYRGGYRRGEVAKKAEEMMAQAKARAEGIENEARERGYADGLEKGRKEAVNEVNSIMESLKSGIDSLMRTRKEFFEEAEKEMVDLVALVSSEIVLKKVEEDGEVIKNVIRKAVSEIHSQQKITVRVNSADFANVKNMADSLVSDIDAVEGVEFIEDPKVTQGGCIVETNIGVLDATVENRLKVIHRNLRQLLDKKE